MRRWYEKVELTEEEKKRFWAKVDKTGNCWVWAASRFDNDYGRFNITRNGEGRNYRAHRVAYQLCVGDIPEGMFVCHHCDNPSCVNPEHLFIGSNSDNMRDCVAKGRMKILTKIARRGSQNHNSVLNEEQVVEIKKRLANGETQSFIAKDYPVSRQHINRIACNKVWNHIA